MHCYTAAHTHTLQQVELVRPSQLHAGGMRVTAVVEGLEFGTTPPVDEKLSAHTAFTANTKDYGGDLLDEMCTRYVFTFMYYCSSCVCVQSPLLLLLVLLHSYSATIASKQCLLPPCSMKLILYTQCTLCSAYVSLTLCCHSCCCCC
jgi:hypothetical protein